MENRLWQDLTALLERGESAALAVIVTRDGSAPRSAGARLLADAGGIRAGTLGGGPAEAEAAAKARGVLAVGESCLYTVDMGGSALAGADLICGGTVQIFIRRAGPELLGVFRRLMQRLRAGRDSVLLTPVQGPADSVLLADEDMPADLREVLEENKERVFLLRRQDIDYIAERITAPYRLIAAGGGHVSLPVTQIAALAGFEVTVLDDRNEFAVPKRFPWLPPERVLTVPEFRGCLTEDVLGFAAGPRCGIAILTRGHAFDSEVLEQALALPLGYIGMIGSRRKREAVYDKLAARGVPREKFERVFCPIGLDLGGDTPAEIAVSIAAQLVQFQTGKLSALRR